jgi:drug/metabolite transporter (DMT)-like permease
VAAAVSGVLVGAALVATRTVVGQTGPASLALLRYLIGTLCLMPFALRGGIPRFAWRDVGPIALLGIGQFGLLIVLLNFSLLYISSARAALVFATTPLLTMLLAAAGRQERLGLWRSVGVLLTIAGVGLALGEKALAGGSSFLGEGAALGSALLAAGCGILYRPYLRRYPVLPVSAFAMLAAVLFLAALAAGEGFFAAVPDFGVGWLAVVFIGFCSGLGYYTWLYALRHASPTKVTVFLALSPVTAALLGWLLGEPPTAGTIVGIGLVALGLFAATR